MVAEYHNIADTSSKLCARLFQPNWTHLPLAIYLNMQLSKRGFKLCGIAKFRLILKENKWHFILPFFNPTIRIMIQTTESSIQHYALWFTTNEMTSNALTCSILRILIRKCDDHSSYLNIIKSGWVESTNFESI